MEEMSKTKRIILNIFLVIIFILMIGFIIYVCVTEDTLSGRWEIYSVRYQGDKFSLNELKVIDKDVYDKVINNYFVLKEGGNAIVNFGEEKLVKWEKIDDIIKLDDKEFLHKSNYLIVKYDENYELYFSRVSSNQSIVDKDDEKDNSIQDINEKSSLVINNDDLDVSATIVSDGNVVVLVLNNGNDLLDVEVEVVFYDRDGKKVGSEDGKIIALGNDQGGAVKIDTYGMKFDSFKIYVDGISSDGVKSYNDKIKVSYREGDDEIKVVVNNNTGVNLDEVNISVIYFKDEDVVGIENESEYDLENGKNVSMNFDFPYNYSTGNYIEFDDFQVFINMAYAYED